MTHAATIRNGRRYRARMDWLRQRLGGRCALAGQEGHFCRGRLEVDHVDGRGWRVEQLSSHQRVERLIRELEDGVRLRLLCASANAALGGRVAGKGRRALGRFGKRPRTAAEFRALLKRARKG